MFLRMIPAPLQFLSSDHGQRRGWGGKACQICTVGHQLTPGAVSWKSPFCCQSEDGDACGHTVILCCQLQTSSQFLWSTFPQIRFLPGKTLTISYSAFNQQQLVWANGPGHCLGLHMISLQKRQTFTQTRPACWTFELPPLRYNETISIFHLNKKSLSHLKSSWLSSLSGLAIW